MMSRFTRISRPEWDTTEESELRSKRGDGRTQQAMAISSKTVLSRPEGLPLLHDALQRDAFLQTARS